MTPKRYEAYCITLLTSISTIFGAFPRCKDGIQSKVCTTQDEYIVENEPFPIPVQVNLTVNIIDILDVDEEAQTVTVQLKTRLNWIDDRLSVNRSENDISKNIEWFLIDWAHLNSVWKPRIYLGNAVEIRNLESLGDNYSYLSHFWLYSVTHMMQYSEQFIAKISCTMKFQKFPFDNHTCEMQFINWVQSSFRVQINQPTILTYNPKLKNEIGGLKLNKSSSRISYQFEFASRKSTQYIDMGFNYSMALIKMKFDRTEEGRAKIFSSYHAPTGTFALMSLVSFFIKVEFINKLDN